MLGAGLVARKAVELGLSVPPYVKTSLSPGSGVVTKYLESSGLLPDLEKLGYFITGYGCMTCIDALIFNFSHMFFRHWKQWTPR